MKGLLLSAVLAIAYWPDIGARLPVQPRFDPKQLAGKWYAAAIVKTNGPPESIVILHHIVEPLPNGDIVMRAQIPVKNTCKEVNIRLAHSDRSGIFTVGMGHILTVVEAEYGSYYMLHIDTPENNVLQLFVREPVVPMAVENMFLSSARSLGFNLNLILNLNNIDRCP